MVKNPQGDLFNIKKRKSRERETKDRWINKKYDGRKERCKGREERG